MFDARKYRESLEKPTFIDVDDEGNEVKFEGELVPFNTVATHIDSFANLEGKTEAEIDEIIFAVIKAIRMDERVMEFLKKLPIGGRLEAVLSFFESLRGIKKKA